MVLGSYKLTAAIERGTKLDALRRKPCHWTSTLEAAMGGRDAGVEIRPHALHDLVFMEWPPPSEKRLLCQASQPF
jgi:hypothetical protein